MCPSSSTVVVLPFVPVTATKRFGNRPPGELQLPNHVDPPLQRRRDHRRLPRHPGLLTTVRTPSRSANSICIQDDFDTDLPKPCRPIGMPGIDRKHLRPTIRQQPRHGLPRAGQPDDQERPAGQRWPGLPGRRGAHPGYLRSSGGRPCTLTSPFGRICVLKDEVSLRHDAVEDVGALRGGRRGGLGGRSRRPDHGSCRAAPSPLASGGWPTVVNETTSSKLDLLEAKGKRRPRGLGRVALAPSRARQPPADLDGRREVRLELGHSQPGEPNELAGPSHLERPEPKPIRLKPSLDLLDQLITLPPT